MESQDDGRSVVSGDSAVEEAVEREITRRRQLLYTFTILLLVPIGVGIVFLRYGRSDRKLVAREVQQEVAPLQDLLNSTQKATSDLDGQLSAANAKIGVTQDQAKRASEVAAAALRDSATMSSTLKGELAAKANYTDVNVLGNTVIGVREDIQSLDSKVGGVLTDLDATRNNLQMARNELGTLIAGNHSEVEQLRRLGERDYIEFTVPINKNGQKVGFAVMAVREINRKRNRYSAMVEINDKQLEFENRSIDEVIYLHLSGSLQPAELVVTQLTQDKVLGYLSVPKSLEPQDVPH